MKSILANFRRSNPAILMILKALNFDVLKHFTIVNVKKIPQNGKFGAAKMVKMAVFDLLKLAKIDFQRSLKS